MTTAMLCGVGRGLDGVGSGAGCGAGAGTGSGFGFGSGGSGFGLRMSYITQTGRATCGPLSIERTEKLILGGLAVG